MSDRLDRALGTAGKLLELVVTAASAVAAIRALRRDPPTTCR